MLKNSINYVESSLKSHQQCSSNSITWESKRNSRTPGSLWLLFKNHIFKNSWQLNAANRFQDQSRLSSVMFLGTLFLYLVELRMNPFLHDTYSVTPSALYFVLYNKQKSILTRKCLSECSKISRYCSTSLFLPLNM